MDVMWFCSDQVDCMSPEVRSGKQGNPSGWFGGYDPSINFLPRNVNMAIQRQGYADQL